MNEREGRIGKKEGASLVLISCVISALFAVDTEKAYANGNSLYASTLLAALVAYLAFVFICAAMRKCGTAHLYGLYLAALGKWLGGAFSAITVCSLLIAAVLPLTRMFLIMSRYVYMGASVENIALYFVPVIAYLMLKGLETVGRTAKLYAIATVLSIALAFLIVIPTYDPYRLYPLMGDGIISMLKNALMGTERFLPALLALLVCGKGVHGVDCAAAEGGAGALFAGGFSAASQLCLGMIYPYQELAGMHSPMYRATMSVQVGGLYVRTDKVLLFFWTAAAMIAGSFYGYAAALLYCRAFSIRDIRPVAAVLAVVIISGMVMGQESFPWFERAGSFVSNYLFAFLLGPALIAGGVALFKREKKEASA